MNIKITLFSTVVAASMLTSCGEKKQQTLPQATFKTMKVTTKDVTLPSSYSATIRGRQDIDVLPQVGGTLQQLLVTEGQRVTKGQPMFIIDQVPYQAAVAQAEAGLEQAKAANAQAKAGLENSMASLEAARAGLNTARAGLEQAQAGYQAALATKQAAESGLATAQLNYDSRQKLFDQKVISEFDLKTAYNQLLSAKAQVAQCDAQIAQTRGAITASNAQLNQCNAQISQCEAGISAGRAAVAQSEAGISAAQAQLTNARNSLSYTVVKSPADGVVGKLPYRQGALVSSNMPQPLTTVSDNTSMYVYFTINENKLLELVRQYGSTEEAVQNMPAVQLLLSDGSQYPATGRVETVSGVIDQSTGTTQLRAVFDNPDGILHSGNTGSVIIPVDYKNVLTIPATAAVQTQDKFKVYVVDAQGIAHSQIISVNQQSDGREFIVTSGLKGGEEIVAEGAGMVTEEQNVKPKKEEKK